MMGSWISEFVSIIFVNENLPAALIVCWQVFVTFRTLTLGGIEKRLLMEKYRQNHSA